MREYTQFEIKRNFIDFLEADLECYEIDRPETYDWHTRDDFFYASSQKWATQELLKRLRASDDAEQTIYEFCSEMYDHMRIAIATKRREAKDHFDAAYHVAYFLIEMFDSIAFGEDDD